MIRYYCLYRPPMPFAVPKGFKNSMAFDEKIFVQEIGREAWGWVEYEKPLTPQQVDDYELAAAQLTLF